MSRDLRVSLLDNSVQTGSAGGAAISSAGLGGGYSSGDQDSKGDGPDGHKMQRLIRLASENITLEGALQYGVDGFLEALKREGDAIPDLRGARPRCEIRFKNLSYKELISNSTAQTTGAMFKNVLTCCFKKQTQQNKTILNKLSGVLKAGSMTLLLGPPLSGKTSFLKALAGRIPREKLSGRIEVNGQDVKELKLENLFDFVQQSDDHLPNLTVRETLEFAMYCTHLGSVRRRGVSDSSGQGIDGGGRLQALANLWGDICLKFLGIYHVAETVVGNENIRGVSGGQKKRVTVGEMLIGPKPVFLCDEITTGLDSATAFDILKGLHSASKIFGITFVISLLQPSPEIVELFDDIILLSKGQIAYHGPRELAIPYFEGLGFEVPFYKDRADFLQDITTPLGKNYIKAGAVSPPHTSSDFVSRFKENRIFKDNIARAKAPWDHKLEEEHLDKLNYEFQTTWWQNLKLVTWRQWLLTKRNREYTRKRITQCIFVSVLLGWLCWQISHDNARLKYSVFFFVLTFLALGNIPVMAMLLEQRAIFYKQRDSNFFRTSTYAIAVTLCSLPLAIMEALIVSSIVYFMTGLHNNAGEFFIFVVVVLLISLSLASLFRFLATIMPDLTTAQPVVGGAIILQTLFAGFLITKNNITTFWIWAYWLTPLSYAFKALCLNEFHSSSYTLEEGNAFLDGMGITNDDNWVYYSIIYMFLFWVLFVGLQTAGLHYLRFRGVGGSGNSEMEEEDDDPFKEEHKVDMKEGLRSLPFTPMTLTFQDVIYSVPDPKDKKERLTLLNRVSGFAKPGRMTALMGESGAGKTTLMDVLAGRKTGGKIEGNILFNGFAQSKRDVARMIGYVEQMDIHSPTSTVYEALWFSAKLRLPEGVSDETRRQFVMQVLDLLELTPLKDDLIGDKGYGLSLEQRKRVTIGVELVSNPTILFLDEPTSGLDSRAAQIVMKVMRNIAETGRAVVCTIHQPSAEIFTLFDDLLLLVRGGKVAYLGELGTNCSNLVTYLQKFPGTEKIRAGKNPADWMLEVVGKASIGEDFSVRYHNSPIREENEEQLARLMIPPTGSSRVAFDTPWAAGLGTQYKETLRKTNRHYWRSPSYSFTRVLFMILIALLYGTVFEQIPIHEQSGLQSAIALIYSTTVFSGVISMQAVIPVVGAERAVFYRERAANTYAVLPYAFAITLVELPYLISVSSLFVVILYFLVGLKATVGSYFFYTLTFTVYTIFQVYLGQFLAIAMPNNQVAALTGSGLVTIWNLFCGFLIPKPSIPNFWIWLYWTSPTRYIIEALEVNQFYCDYKSNVTCPLVEVIIPGGTMRMPIWKYVESGYGFERDLMWPDVLVLFGMVCALQIAKFLALKHINHLKR